MSGTHGDLWTSSRDESACETLQVRPSTRADCLSYLRHALLHTYASGLIADNVHPRGIQARLGHKPIVETMDTYGHLFPDAEDHGRGALDTLFSEAAVPPACPERVVD